MNVSLGMVLEAREHLKGVVHRTDLVPSKPLSNGEYQVYLKSESLQDTGSFKVRGAYIKIASLTPEERAAGVIASSAGNHAQGVALAARTFGVPATIVMPEGAPIAKVKATRELGATVVLHGTVYDDAFAYACKLQKESGATFIHPFNDPMVIAGQGTIGLEIVDDMPDVDAIVVPIGGGGLAAGIAVAVKSLHPNIRVIGVEAAGDAFMLYLMERCKIVTEGAGAAAVAAIMGHKFECRGKVAAVLSGGNIDVTMLSRIIEKGMLKAGRMIKLRVVMEDKPGQLTLTSRIIAECGGNVVQVHHDRSCVELGINHALLEVSVETQDRDHAERIIGEIKRNGFSLLA